MSVSPVVVIWSQLISLQIYLYCYSYVGNGSRSKLTPDQSLIPPSNGACSPPKRARLSQCLQPPE